MVMDSFFQTEKAIYNGSIRAIGKVVDELITFYKNSKF